MRAIRPGAQIEPLPDMEYQFQPWALDVTILGQAIGLLIPPNEPEPWWLSPSKIAENYDRMRLFRSGSPSESAAIDAGTHEPAVDDFGNQYLARLSGSPSESEG